MRIDGYPAVSAVGVAVVVTIGAALTLGRHAHAEGGLERPLRDRVARLQHQLDVGEVHLDFRPGIGYLPGLLETLDLHADSQLLVFSKTSFQQTLISLKAPRALYFNDETAVGSVQGGEVFEVMSLDPDEGFIFYTFPTRETDAPRFQRRGSECVFCHLPGNHGAAGLVVASVIPNAEGVPFFGGSFFATTDDRTPFEQRWGGWYVTGTHGTQTHMGNAVAPDPDRPVDLDQTGNGNVTTLAGRVDLRHYIAATSDIVALMTLAHQAGAMNRILGLSQQYARAQTRAATDTVWRTVDDAVDDLVRYMLFADEAPFKDPVAGVSTFTKTFPARGPRDAKGRSLRDFDLTTRLFRYPLSYTIYSDAFDHLPSRLRDQIYQRLYASLSGADTSASFYGLSADRRHAALEILLDTKSEARSGHHP